MDRSIGSASGAKGKSFRLRASAYSDHDNSIFGYLQSFEWIYNRSCCKAWHDSPLVACSRTPSRINFLVPKLTCQTSQSSSPLRSCLIQSLSKCAKFLQLVNHGTLMICLRGRQGMSLNSASQSNTLPRTPSIMVGLRLTDVLFEKIILIKL